MTKLKVPTAEFLKTCAFVFGNPSTTFVGKLASRERKKNNAKHTVYQALVCKQTFVQERLILELFVFVEK